MVEQTTHDIVALALEIAGIAAFTPDADTGKRLMIVAVRLLEEAGLPRAGEGQLLVTVA